MAFQHTLARMARIVRRVVVHYPDDFKVHDTRTLSAAQPGDLFLWTPRTCGTQLAALRYQGHDHDAVEYVAAVNAVMKVTVWYIVRPDGLKSIPAVEALRLARVYAERSHAALAA